MMWTLDGLRPPPRWLWAALMAAILTLAVYLRLYHLGTPSFWHDEVFSLAIVDRPFVQLWGLWFDVHPPLYYMLLKGWLALVGHDDAGLRLLSVLFSLATLPAIYLIGRRIGGAWLGLAALLCLAVHPFAIDYARELRMYALLECIAAWTLYGLARLLASPERAALPLRARGGDRLGWALVGIGSLLALYTHNLGLLLPFAITVVAVSLWWGLPERPALARNWAIVHGAVLLLWAPWLPELLKQTRHVSGYAWLAVSDAWEVLTSELSVAFGLRHFEEPLTWAMAAGLAALAIAGALALPRRPQWAAALLLLFLLPPLGSLAISFLHRPVYLARTLIWSGLPIVVLLGAGIVALFAWARGWRLALAAVALALLTAGNSAAVWRQLRANHDDWRDVAIAVDALTGPDDLVVVPGIGGDPLAYYLARRAEKSGEPPPLMLRHLEAGLPKTVKVLWLAPERDRYLRIETPWHRKRAGFLALLHLRFPCHREMSRSERSGMILWLYARDPACAARVPGLPG